jgi:hypothetical protein
MVTHVNAIVIVILGLALGLFYIQTVCQKILARRFNEEYFRSIANANQLEFPFVRKAVEEFDAPVDYPWIRMALKCDYLALTYLLKNAANAKRRYARNEVLLMIYFRTVLFVLGLLHLLKMSERPAIVRLTEILQHFADVVGERVSNVRFGDLSASDYLLSL